jgi:dTDP-glucose pyrophosphorylase
MNNNKPLHIFILCGGNGTRMDDYSFPKPLNMIYGKPLIYYTLLNLPEEIKELNFIVSQNLVKYNFNEIIINLFPNYKCNFYNLPYYTRGPLESAYLGVKNLNLSGSILFLDNDNIYTFPKNFYKMYNTSFIGYYINTTNTSSFSFIELNENNFVFNIKEKIKISNNACCGVYGFKDLIEFIDIAKNVLDNYNDTKELYMSMLYEKMININRLIIGIEFPYVNHVGSYNELINTLNIFKKEQKRICFTLDNVIITYPTIPNDYSTVKPIIKMIKLIRNIKQQGHYIIIYSTRELKDNIEEITYKTLKDFNIPYDEIIFGKIKADIFIDDKTINPYRNNISLLGIFEDNDIEIPLNKLENNKYNSVILENNIIKKTGLNKYLEGEIYYYKTISTLSDINILFPIYYNSTINNNDTSNLYIENINGIPFYTLYKNEMITENNLNKLFEIIKNLHNYKKDNDINYLDIIDNYSTKLKERFSNKNDYPFEDAEEIQNNLLEKLENYYKRCNNKFECSQFIHGDLWFSNIIISYTNNIKLIDMKGKLYNKYNTGGHIYYDYGKLYQSFLGYDEIINNDNININYKNKLLIYYENYLESINIDLKDLKLITFSLVMGTFNFISNEETKIKLWNWIKNVFI